jgi:hypothetical protein
MFKALFVPQGFLTLAVIALIGYRQWTGEWPQFSALNAQGTAKQSLSWDRQTDESLNAKQLQNLKREILDQLDRMNPRHEPSQP